MKKSMKRIICVLLAVLAILIFTVPGGVGANAREESVAVQNAGSEENCFSRLFSWIEELWGRLFGNESRDAADGMGQATPETDRIPETTEAPKPTESPKATETPKVTEAPKPTESPKATEAPQTVETPQQAETPKETEAPRETELPENTAGSSALPMAEAEAVLALVNRERSAAGLAPLTLDTDLCRVATVKAEDMQKNNYFSHTSPTYGSPFDMMKRYGISYRSAGENIAMGYRTADSVMEGWMNSDGHRANILNPSFTKLGVGYCAEGNYWVQMFIG